MQIPFRVVEQHSVPKYLFVYFRIELSEELHKHEIDHVHFPSHKSERRVERVEVRIHLAQVIQHWPEERFPIRIELFVERSRFFCSHRQSIVSGKIFESKVKLLREL